MDTYWLDKLFDLLSVQTNSENEKRMVLYLDKELKRLKLPYSIDAVGNIIVTKGKADTYPCVVSHMDTVHSFVDNFGVYRDIDDKDILFALNGKQRVGIGGDDKCGIFGCLYLLKTIPQIKVVFFSREEQGCKGSMGINKDFFADCRYLIELDRNGSRDFIQTYWGSKTISHEFSSEIGLIKKKYKYRNRTGTVTDVMKLWNNKVGISCINLSCGYFKPHSAYEYVSISDLWHSVKFTEEIVLMMQPKRYVSLPPEPIVAKVLYAPITNYQSKYSQCNKCKKWKKEALLYDYKGKLICWPCKKELYSKTFCSKPPSGDIVLLACHECGKRTDEMKKGDNLKNAGDDGYLYCDSCAKIFFVSDKKPMKCEVCESTIPKGHYHTKIQGMLVCGVCAHELDRAVTTDGSPVKCWVCDKVIPKDHKIIERFGTRVCEDCACSSDTIVC